MTASTPTLRQWIRDHDESWLFVVVYLGMAVGLSVFVSLFWLVVVAFIHFLLELLRQSHYRVGARDVSLHALWEVKLDIGLVLLALMLVLYIDVVLGILGIQSAARAAGVTRAGARVATRAAAWERNLRTFLLTVDEMARVAHAGFVFWRKGKEREGTAEGAPASDGPASTGDGTSEGRAPADQNGATENLTPAHESGDMEDPAPTGEKGDTEDRTPTDENGATEDPTTADENGESEAQPPAEDEGSVPAPTEHPEVRVSPEPPLPPAWSERWGIGDRFGVGLVAAGLLLIVAAPLLTSHDWSTAAALLLEELRPFPS